MVFMKKTGLFKLLSLFAFALLLQACDQDVVFQQQQRLPAEGWHFEDCAQFEAEIRDSLSLHTMYLDVRNTTDYAYSNLYIFLDIEFPDQRVFRDTIAAILADRRGQWTGSGFGHLRAQRFLFRDDVWFPSAGTYRFKICHGMRYDTLNGISDVGIRIERK